VSVRAATVSIIVVLHDDGFLPGIPAGQKNNNFTRLQQKRKSFSIRVHFGSGLTPRAKEQEQTCVCTTSLPIEGHYHRIEIIFYKNKI
jgi:hypothetical protein